jgi:hypothetical protein
MLNKEQNYIEVKRKKSLEKLKTYDKDVLIECIMRQGDMLLENNEVIIPENIELHNRINKAIRALEEGRKKEALKILKGESNE